MKKLVFAVLGIIIGISLIGGLLTLIGTIIGTTFGLIGTIVGLLFGKFMPVVLIVIIIILAYKLNKKSA